MDIFALLSERFPRLSMEKNFSFARHTTIGCGGTAAVSAAPSSAEETACLVRFMRENGIVFCYLGAGANVLPADGYFQGVVIRFCNMQKLYARGTLICAEAGATNGALLRFTAERGIGGFEPFSAIPASVGGGVAMNAGVRERHYGDLVSHVIAAEDGRIRVFSASECRFGEKESVFLSGIAVLAVVFEGVRSAPEQIARNALSFRVRRRALPKGHSMGCVFVNPLQKETAAQLIERSGLKGRRIGGAFVSPQHANFIINEGGTARDVAALIACVHESVLRQTGISLREEIRRIPFATPNNIR